MVEKNARNVRMLFFFLHPPLFCISGSIRPFYKAYFTKFRNVFLTLSLPNPEAVSSSPDTPPSDGLVSSSEVPNHDARQGDHGHGEHHHVAQQDDLCVAQWGLESVISRI